VVVYIHAGGFLKGDKAEIRGDPMVRACHDAGISFAAINYRFLSETTLPEILRDAARAVQFIRSKAGEWNVDRPRIACYGNSAGAGVSLWLAFHADLAGPGNPDPVLRESTRLACAGSISGQFSYDLRRWSELWSEETIQRFAAPYLSPRLYGLATTAELLGPAGQKIRADCDIEGLITRQAPAIYLVAHRPGGEVTDANHFLHHPVHSQRIYERCRALEVPVVAEIPALGIVPATGQPATLRDFFLRYLPAPSQPTARAR
jgi:acetyl esterase/lipase